MYRTQNVGELGDLAMRIAAFILLCSAIHGVAGEYNDGTGARFRVCWWRDAVIQQDSRARPSRLNHPARIRRSLSIDCIFKYQRQDSRVLPRTRTFASFLKAIRQQPKQCWLFDSSHAVDDVVPGGRLDIVLNGTITRKQAHYSQDERGCCILCLVPLASSGT